MVAIFIIAVVAGSLFLTFALPEIRLVLKGISFGGSRAAWQDRTIGGGIRRNGRQLDL